MSRRTLAFTSDLFLLSILLYHIGICRQIPHVLETSGEYKYTQEVVNGKEKSLN